MPGGATLGCAIKTCKQLTLLPISLWKEHLQLCWDKACKLCSKNETPSSPHQLHHGNSGTLHCTGLCSLATASALISMPMPSAAKPGQHLLCPLCSKNETPSSPHQLHHGNSGTLHCTGLCSLATASALISMPMPSAAKPGQHLLCPLCSLREVSRHGGVTQHRIRIVLALHLAAQALLLAHLGHVGLGGLHHPFPQAIILAPALMLK